MEYEDDELYDYSIMNGHGGFDEVELDALHPAVLDVAGDMQKTEKLLNVFDFLSKTKLGKTLHWNQYVSTWKNILKDHEPTVGDTPANVN